MESWTGCHPSNSNNQPLVQVIVMVKIGNYEAVCGLCDSDLEGPANPKPQDTFRCTGCGNSDTLENITRIIGEFITNSIKQPPPPSGGKAVKAGNSKNLVLKFKPKGGHHIFVSLKP